MSEFSTPLKYINKEHILEEAGKYIKCFGVSAFIIGTQKSLAATEEILSASLGSAGIQYNSRLFEGYTEYEKADEYVKAVKEANADVIIGTGGGRVLDFAKAVAYNSGLKTVTIPTIAATGAAYRANPVMYDANGGYVDTLIADFAPVLVLVDPGIIIRSPVRYLYAGILDSWAKYYETLPYRDVYSRDIHLNFAYGTSKAAHDYLKNHLEEIIDAHKNGVINQTFTEALDAIIAYPGLAGSYKNGVGFAGFAHPFYNSVTRKRKTRAKLHGEIVAYGVLAQLILEKRAPEEFAEIFELFTRAGFHYTAFDIGITDREVLYDVAKDIWNCEHENFKFLSHITSWDQYADAIKIIDEALGGMV